MLPTASSEGLAATSSFPTSLTASISCPAVPHLQDPTRFRYSSTVNCAQLYGPLTCLPGGWRGKERDGDSSDADGLGTNCNVGVLEVAVVVDAPVTSLIGYKYGRIDKMLIDT